MGIVYNSKNYISNQSIWKPTIIHQRAFKALTRRNKEFLRSQGLRVVPAGK